MEKENSKTKEIISLRVRLLRFFLFILFCNLITAVLIFLSRGAITGILILFDVFMMFVAFSVLFQKFESTSQKIAKSARITKYSLLVIPCIALLGFVLYYFLASFSLAFMLFMVGAMITIILSIYINKKVLEKNCKEFADKMGYIYLTKAPTESIPLAFRKLGSSLFIKNVFETIYQKYPVRMFTLALTVGGGKRKQTFECSVYEITFPLQVPTMIIATKEGVASWADGFSVEHLETVHLEGNFDTYFTTQSVNSAQMEIRIILSPDIMAFMIDEMSEYSFIFMDNKLYICYPGQLINYIEELTDEEVYIQQLEKIQSLVSKWLPSILNIHR